MSAQTLPCGRDALDVWDHAAGGSLDGHEQTCPYCQGVVDEYDALAEPTERWRAHPIDAPIALLERVMATVRAGLRARNYLPLVSPYGPVQLDTATAAAALRWVVDQVDGSRARSCKIQPVDLQPAPDEGGAPPDPAVTVRLTIIARSAVRLPPLAADIRRLIRAVGTELLGLDIVAVDIDIVDLFEPSPADGPLASPAIG